MQGDQSSERHIEEDSMYYEDWENLLEEDEKDVDFLNEFLAETLAEHSFIDAPILYDNDGVEKFAYLTQLMGLRPIFKMKEMLRSEKIDLKYYGIDPRIVKPLCDVLEKNTYVRQLIFQLIKKLNFFFFCEIML